MLSKVVELEVEKQKKEIVLTSEKVSMADHFAYSTQMKDLFYRTPLASSIKNWPTLSDGQGVMLTKDGTYVLSNDQLTILNKVAEYMEKHPTETQLLKCNEDGIVLKLGRVACDLSTAEVDRLLLDAFVSNKGWKKTIGILCEGNFRDSNITTKSWGGFEYITPFKIATYLQAIVMNHFDMPIEGWHAQFRLDISVPDINKMECLIREVFAKDAPFSDAMAKQMVEIFGAEHAMQASEHLRAIVIRWFEEHVTEPAVTILRTASGECVEVTFQNTIRCFFYFLRARYYKTGVKVVFSN